MGLNYFLWLSPVYALIVFEGFSDAPQEYVGGAWAYMFEAVFQLFDYMVIVVGLIQ